jgi:hypothetical protein
MHLSVSCLRLRIMFHTLDVLAATRSHRTGCKGFVTRSSLSHLCCYGGRRPRGAERKVKRGLVHKDLKPAKILLSTGTVEASLLGFLAWPPTVRAAANARPCRKDPKPLLGL